MKTLKGRHKFRLAVGISLLIWCVYYLSIYKICPEKIPCNGEYITFSETLFVFSAIYVAIAGFIISMIIIFFVLGQFLNKKSKFNKLLDKYL